MTALCPSCGQSLLGKTNVILTERELDVLSAWWHFGSVRSAATILSIGEQRAKNLLYRARIRAGVHTTEELVQRHFAELRPKADLLRRRAA